MEIRDVIHGPIRVDPLELLVIDSKYFQRLRQIRQLGFAENSFPGATHNRYIHSLGAMQVATLAFDSIFRTDDSEPGIQLSQLARRRFRAVLRMAALLHDVGHGPLSHTTEFAMPQLSELALPKIGTSRKATHEDYTLKMILDSGLTPLIEKVGQEHGFKPHHIAALINSDLEVSDHFFKDTPEGLPTIDFFPLLKQLISSEMDADRMDYLRRDSLHTGVSYGQFDFGWIMSNLMAHIHKNKAYLCLHHRALYAFEDFLLSRYHMFLMVYFHHKSLMFDEMLGQYLASPDCRYALPADIEKYTETSDAHIFADLAQSPNPWAKRIMEKKPYRVLVELHSGIPATKTAHSEQEKLLKTIRSDLEKRKIHYLEVTSTSELSKYFRRPGDPIYVLYDNHYSRPSFIPLEECTDLFEKYAEKRSITRLYVSPEDYPNCKSSTIST
jgi:HD superfamily phosphohydrolase